MKCLKITHCAEIDLNKSNLSLGFGLFETLKIENTKPVFLKRHLKRLEKSLITFNLGTLPDFNEIKAFLQNFLNSEKTENKALKLIAVDDKLIFLLRDYLKPQSPVIINISKNIRYSKDILTAHKTTSYFFNRLLMEESKEENVYESLVFNELGNLTEGGKTNIFVIKGNKVFTPKVEDGILNGIIRRELIENIEVKEQSLSEKTLLESDEIFLTNSLIGIQPVLKIKGIKKTFQFNQTNKFKKILKL